MFCMNCGKEFEGSKMARYCPTCAAKKKDEAKQKQKKYAKDRNERLGLVTITIYKTDKEIISKLANEQETTLAEIVKVLVANMGNAAPEAAEPEIDNTSKDKKKK